MERCFGSVKNSLQKKQGAVSHFSTEGDQTLLKIYLSFPLKHM